MTWDTEIYDDVPGLKGVLCAFEKNGLLGFGLQTIRIYLSPRDGLGGALVEMRSQGGTLRQHRWNLARQAIAPYVATLQADGWRVVFP